MTLTVKKEPIVIIRS